MQGVAAVLQTWRNDPRVWRNVVLERRIDPDPGSFAPMPEDLSPQLIDALERRGVSDLFSHQARALEAVRFDRDVVIATPTASGKSLCFNLPVLDRLAADPSARALYLFPTKALSRDQEAALRALMKEAGLEHGAVTYDGDTPADARRAARERGGVLITNPDMLHAGILPHHTNWARLFSNLHYVVVDELHTYRGVLGSHVANVLRRLDRVARFHGSNPIFIFASATIGNPREHAERILGRPVQLIDESGAPTGPRDVVIYNPPVVNAELGIRASTIKSAVSLTEDLVRAQVPTLLFGQSRNTVEVMLKYLRDRLEGEIDPDQIMGYRGGYLPGMRRNIERGLRAGEVRCVVSTTALELGIDIGMLDAVVCAGYPGTVAGLWQRFGRAGRRGEQSLAVLVTSSAPLDQYFAAHPEVLLDAPIEHARIDPDNVEILVQHLKCAAFELPFEVGDGFRDVPALAVADALDFLADHDVLHPVEDANGSIVYHWSDDTYPATHVSLRNIGWDNFVVIDVEEKRTIAEMDWRSSHTMLHEQAIYQQDGIQYQVEKLDFDNHKAYVRRVEPDYFTTAMTYTRVSVMEEADGAELAWNAAPALIAGQGDVSVVEKVIGFKKIKFHTHENVGFGEVTLPEMQMHTTAFWLTVPETVVAAQPVPRPTVIDTLRGFAHALHTVAAVGLMIDARDLGETLGDGGDGKSAPRKIPGAGGQFDPTIFLYDRFPGGVGLAARLFEERDTLVRRARRLIEGCDCDDGCPACIGPGVGLVGDDEAGAERKRVAVALMDALGVPAAG
ncbi:MAG: DEAD/DEAH box helicase [Myxococcota bacterium]